MLTTPLQTATGRRVLGAFALVLAFTAAITGVSLYSLERTRHATDQLVNERLARERASAALLAEARLNHASAVAIANSDSLELADYFKLRLTASDAILAQGEAAPGALAPAEATLAHAIGAARARYQKTRAAVFELKDMGRTSDASRAVEEQLAPAFDAYAQAIQGLLAWQSAAARALAAEVGSRYAASRNWLLALGLAACAAALGLAWRLTVRLVNPLRAAVAYAEHVAAGDLSRTLPPGGADDVGQLLRALSSMVQDLGHKVGQVRAGAVLVDATSRDLAEGNRDLAARTEHQASAVQQTAASIEQLSASARDNARHARSASDLASTASAVVTRAGAEVGNMVATMEAINGSAQRIVEITGVIDAIAFQTNLLALNAAVEAARAGEQGRGFAVVASEVRQLAQRAATAAKEIKQLIHLSATHARDGSKVADAAGATMAEVVDTIGRVSRLVQNIDRASAEQQAGIDAIHAAMGSMDAATQQNGALVEQAANAAAHMQAQAAELAAIARSFRTAPLRLAA